MAGDAEKSKKGFQPKPETLMADEARFELAEGVALTRFRGVLLRPLGHSSIRRNQATCSLCHTLTSRQIIGMSSPAERYDDEPVSVPFCGGWVCDGEVLDEEDVSAEGCSQLKRAASVEG